MKISELIEELERIKDKAGDLELTSPETDEFNKEYLNIVGDELMIG
jgi:hypothetical protein